MADRKWKEGKQQPSMLLGSAVPGSSLASFYFLWAILCPQAVKTKKKFLIILQFSSSLSGGKFAFQSARRRFSTCAPLHTVTRGMSIVVAN